MGIVAGAVFGAFAVGVASLLPIFDLGNDYEAAIQTVPTTTSANQAPAPTTDDLQAAQPGTGQGRGRGGPPEGRGPGSQTAVQIHATPLADGTAAPVVLDAFAAGGCVACHSIKGVGGGQATIGPPLFQTGAIAADRRPGPTPEAYIEESILDPGAFIMPNCPTGPCLEGVMPQTFGETLTADQLATIVDYLAALGTSAEGEVLTRP